MSKYSIDDGVNLAVFILVVAGIVPGAMETIFAVDTANWSAPAQTIWGLLPVLAIVSLLFIVYKKRGK